MVHEVLFLQIRQYWASLKVCDDFNDSSVDGVVFYTNILAKKVLWDIDRSSLIKIYRNGIMKWYQATLMKALA